MGASIGTTLSWTSCLYLGFAALDLFRRPASVTQTLLASSCPSLELCHLSLSENLLGGIYCSVQPSQPTARGVLLLWSFARHFTDPWVNVTQVLSEEVKMLKGVGKCRKVFYQCKTA